MSLKAPNRLAEARIHKETETTHAHRAEGSGVYLHTSLTLVQVPGLLVVGHQSRSPVGHCLYDVTATQKQSPEAPEANPCRQNHLAPVDPPLD